MPRVSWDEYVRVESSAADLPPLLVVQAGPGFPLLNERRRYRKLLGFEEHFSVYYWDRSGTGLHSLPPGGLGLETHLEDTVGLIERIAQTTGRTVTLLGVSIGGTLALLARQRAPEAVERVVAVSPDLDTAASDRHAYQRIMAAAREPRWRRLATKAARLQPPPCFDPAQFMLRAELLGHLGSVETRSGYGAQLLRAALSIAGTYGPHRLPRILANMNASTRGLLPEYAKVDLLSRWPRSPVPADLLFGDADLLSPAAVIEKVRPLLGPQDTLRVIHNAAHMAHFDAPAVVRSVVVGGKKPAGAAPSAQTAARPRIA